jgi:N-acetyl-anhydromuramyl-L-alanine amidase AmpD
MKLWLILSFLILSNCKQVKIQDDEICAVAGRMVVGGDCYTLITKTHREISMDEIIEMLENGAFIVPSETFTNLKTNIEVLCQYQKNTCTAAKSIEQSLKQQKKEFKKVTFLSEIPVYGDNTEDVKLLQIGLNLKGFNLKADGDFGPKTAAAVVSFKKLNNLYPSNIVTETVLILLGLALNEGDDREQETDSEDRSYINYDDELNIIKHKDIFWQSKGPFNTSNGLPDMILLHYTVSPQTKSAARNLVEYFESTPSKLGYQIACPIVDGDGDLHVSGSWDIWKDRNNNAGKSRWKDRKNISQYALALEIQSWGLLDQKTLPLVKSEDRRFSRARDNIKEGTYHKFTSKQENTIVNACIALKRKNPNFKIENVVSHDEVSPQRKSDVGASLSMSMPDFREYLSKVI